MQVPPGVRGDSERYTAAAFFGRAPAIGPRPFQSTLIGQTLNPEKSLSRKPSIRKSNEQPKRRVIESS